MKKYLCIDLKSFYASVECAERGLNPLTTNLVVADQSRTQKTICLAVSPSLKALGISGRPRLFEVEQKIKEINNERLKKTKNRAFSSSSNDAISLNNNSDLEVSYIIARPRMAEYIKISTMIYKIYLKYVAKEDIHVYSIDEVFMDIESYLTLYKISAYDFAKMLINDVYKTTNITATAGIGTNLYLAKVAMDIVAKHIPADKDGVRIAELDELNYRKLLWNHKPLTDFWRVGHGYASRLAKLNLFTMGDIARCSLGKSTDYYNEDLLYKTFGINAELLIDHAWGYEPCTMQAIKAYKAENNSLGSGQVLHKGYTYTSAKIVIKEMLEQLVLDLIEKRLVIDILSISIGYDIDNLKDKSIASTYKGEIDEDYFGRKIPKNNHGSINLQKFTSSRKLILQEGIRLFDKLVNKKLLVRRLYITSHVLSEDDSRTKKSFEQINLFTDINEVIKNEEQETKELKKEKNLQQTILKIKKKYGKNSIMKVLDLQEDATGRERNEQIGGHKA